MTSPLRILMLEDNTFDAAFVKDLLEAEHLDCEITCVQTQVEFVAALEDPGIDVILADYMLPSFDGLAALALARNARSELPFIFVSGTLGEEVAIEALKNGATDYVVKSRPARLAPSVRRALREAGERAKRKEAEEALRQNQRYLAEAQRLSHTGSFGWDPPTGEIYWSEETYRIFGCDPAITPTVQLVLGRTHPDDRDGLRKIIERATIDKRGFVAEHRIVMDDGLVKFVQIVAHRSDDKAPMSLLFVGTITDISERKQAEAAQERLRQLEAALAHLNRVSVMGELAASIAHEIKQPIAGAAMLARVCELRLQREVPDVAEASNAASRVVEHVTRASSIIDRVTSLYRQGTSEREATDLNEIVREMTALLKNLAGRSVISISLKLDDDIPRTTADRIQIQQVLMNLMLNGIEAMQNTGGTLTVSSKRNEEGQLQIAVRDSGVGFSKSNGDRIFDAFYTTKPQGTGMGLSISRRIIAAHGGRLWAGLNPGGGAVFEFTLPSSPTS